MGKKIISGIFAVGVFSALSYYSGYSFAEKISPYEYPPREIEVIPTAEKEAETEELEPVLEPTAVTTEYVSYAYYLVEEFGKVNIYLSDKETLYEYTDISIDTLPEDLQAEICTGMGVKNEQELYDFLENYSS